MKIALMLSSLLMVNIEVTSQTTVSEISVADIKVHLQYLASDDLEGRKAGTEKNKEAAEYVAKQFEKFGLLPGGDNGTYFQEFEFISTVSMADGNELSFSGGMVPGGSISLVPDVDFRPFGFSIDQEISGGLVFAGYGLSAAEQGYDDYGAPDVEGKVVAVLRYGPDGNNPHGPFFAHSSFRNKARLARDHGASALLVVTGPRDSEEDDLMKLTYDQSFGSSGLPVISMKRSALEALMQKSGNDLGAIQDSIKSSLKPIGFDIPGVRVTLRTNLEHQRSTSSNVIGFLPGSQATDEAEILVVGAHMDHLGYGGPGSGSLEPDTVAIHNGADDNASGTAGLIELAESFASDRGNRSRGLLFVAFSAEEIGTVGSAHYVRNPYVPLSRTLAMINMDMIGRLNDNTLTIYGTGTSPGWNELLARHKAESLFTLKKIEDGFGPSDHAQFYGKDIPVLFFFTGTHNDYHKSSDDWEKINYEGERKILQLVREITDDILHTPERPVFSRVQSTTPGPGSGAGGFSVTLGVIPDYSSAEEGMKIGGLRPNGAADKAGLRSGDVVIGLKGKRISNIYDYMAVLGELKAGQPVEIEVLRGGNSVKTSVTPEKRQ
jgi:hypothetical protein